MRLVSWSSWIPLNIFSQASFNDRMLLAQDEWGDSDTNVMQCNRSCKDVMRILRLCNDG